MYNYSSIEFARQQEFHRIQHRRQNDLYPKQSRCEGCKNYHMGEWGFMECKLDKFKTNCPNCHKCVRPEEHYDDTYCGITSTHCPRCGHTFGSHISE